MNEIKKKTISTICCLSLCCCGVLAYIDSSGKKMQDQDEELYLGIDIGGTSIKMRLFTSKGKRLEEERRVLIDPNASPEEVVKSITTEAANFKHYQKIKSIGVGMPGDIDSDTGIVRFSPNLLKWKNVHLKDLLETSMSRSVYIDNDANVATLGAFYLDADDKVANLVCITLGTGIGGGLVFNKKLYRGSSGSAGEVGHITIESQGPKCNCGNKGCVEAFIGDRYFTKYAQDYLKNNPSKIINELTGESSSPITPKLLFDAAERGDEVAKKMWVYYGEKLGILLADIINFVNPDTIVLCGGFSKSSKYFMPSVHKEVKSRAFRSAVKTCKIVVSQHTSELGTIGAAMLAKEGIVNNDKLDRTDSL
ncbi:MAG: ROK family protein [Endomicrobium sp.]|nr:ROK family protein [Endomicrobium sp.]